MTPGEAAREMLDADNNGIVSPIEMRNKLDLVCLRIDYMLQRLTLERELAAMVLKLPFFLLCLFCFLAALVEFSPSASVSKVHRHLESHFQLSEAKGVKKFGDLYEFILNFEHHNEMLQATSSKYWCEKRYFTKGWDVDLLVPHAHCKSPRYHALGLGEYSSRIKWEEWHASHGSPSQQPTTCEDKDQQLATVEGKPGATCAHEAPHVCEVDLGVSLCPKTCGYCAPFEYERLHKFPNRQVTMLPIVVYQMRYELSDCDGYADIYNKQPVNELLALLPTLDGKRHDQVIRCIDPTKQMKSEKAIEVECSPGSPESACTPCSYDSSKNCVHETDIIDFHGLPVYPKAMITPKADVERMKALDWLDVQTDKVMVSTMIYTARLEIFTSLTVEFAIDEAGNIDEHRKMISYRDLKGGAKTTFIGCLITCSVGALVGVIVSVINLLKNKGECRWGFQVYELVSRSVLFVYPMVLLISWSQQVPMAEEYDMLLHSFLDIKSTGTSEIYKALVKYFDVKTHIYSETSWLKRQRVAANIVVYMQFWQMMLYFSAHPKMAMLTDTISKALTNIIHFLVLFMVIFTMMSFMAHWQLGEYILDFATYGDTVSAQGRMIFGEFIYANGARELHGVMMFMYWMYAFTFLLVMWGLLLNFFLAIVVDAFADIKEESNSSEVVGNFFNDIFDVFVSLMQSYRYGWPPRVALEHFLQDVQSRYEEGLNWLGKLDDETTTPYQEEEKVPVCYPEQLLNAFPKEFKNDDQLAVFICHYYNKLPRLLRRRVHDRREVTRQHDSGVAPFSPASAEHEPKKNPGSAFTVSGKEASSAQVVLPGGVDQAC